MHQYLDDTSGTHKECYTNSSHRLEIATAWLTDPSCAHEGPALLDYLSANANVWLGWSYWCGG